MTPDNSPNKFFPIHQLFRHGGVMGELMQAYDWQSHPLGSPEYWPSSLKTAVRLLLRSNFPMFIWWSRQLYMFHNDPYLPALGKKHPAALGAKATDMWSEIWWQIGGIVERIMDGGESFYADALLIVLERKGFLEETYWTFSYSAAPDDEEEVGGIFCACHEVTATVLGERRLQTIKTVSEAATFQQTVEEASQKICDALMGNPHDVPFGLLYLCDESESRARLAGCTGALPTVAVPPVIELGEALAERTWPLAKVRQSRRNERVDNLLTRLGHLPGGPWPESPERAVIIPLLKPGGQQLLGFFVSGLSPKLEYDEEYHNFHDLLAGTITTVLEGVQARAEAERQRQRLNDLFMQAPAPICILDGPELVYELVNPSYQRLFPERMLLGKPLLEALPELADTPIWRSFQRVYETGQHHEEKERLIFIADYENTFLEDRYFNYIQQARLNQDGRIDGVLVFAFEVTEQVRARRKIEASEKNLQALTEELVSANEEIQSSNEELSAVNQQLQKVNADLDNFVYAASHDLKSPVTSLQTLLTFLHKRLAGKLDAKESEMLAMIQLSGNRLQKTIHDLTQIAKIQRATEEEKETVYFRTILQEVEADLQGLLEQSASQVVASLEVESVEYARKNVRSILYNLLSNALKYRSSARPLRVSIATRMDGGRVVLEVRDNGLGLSATQQENLFTMFKRFHNHVEGSGVGLYMLKRIVENNGGRIEVESKLDEGTAFRVYF